MGVEVASSLDDELSDSENNSMTKDTFFVNEIFMTPLEIWFDLLVHLIQHERK